LSLARAHELGGVKAYACPPCFLYSKMLAERTASRNGTERLSFVFITPAVVTPSLTFSPSHPLTPSPSHTRMSPYPTSAVVTPSPSHPLTLSPSHPLSPSTLSSMVTLPSPAQPRAVAYGHLRKRVAQSLILVLIAAIRLRSSDPSKFRRGLL